MGIQNTFLTLKDTKVQIRRTKSCSSLGRPQFEDENVFKKMPQKGYSFPLSNDVKCTVEDKCSTKTCKPCVFFLFSDCKFGNRCNNCHEPHVANNKLTKLYRWKKMRQRGA